MYKRTWLILALVAASFAFAVNPEVVNGVATYTANKNIGRKFQVPDSWDKIVIKANVTLTGSFYMPTRTRPIEIMGESRETSIIIGDGTRPTDDGIKGRSYSAIRCDKSPDLYVHDLRSLDPMKFHIHGGFGNVTVERCDLIERRGTHTTDGIHGGRGKTIVRDCYIDTWDDALYTIECKLVENTTIVHNKNGSPFMTSWNASVPDNHVCVVRNCTVIDNYSGTDYNHGIFAWAGKNDDAEQVNTISFEGTFTRTVASGKKASPVYTIGRPGGQTIKNAILKIDGLCPYSDSVQLRSGAVNCAVNFVNCGSSASPDTDPVEVGALPEGFALFQNHPNPFNPETRIGYQLSGDAEVRLEVYDMRGVNVRTLVSGLQSVGHHTAFWNATDASGSRVPSGVYLARLTVRSSETNRSDMKKMLLLK